MVASDHGFVSRVERPFGQLLMQRFGEPKIDDLRNGAAFVGGHEDVGRLEIAMNDPFLVCVLLHRPKQFHRAL